MCWSGEASTVVALGGVASAAYCWRRGDSKLLWAPIAYFACMEALQAYTYSVIDQCSDPRNQVATVIAYIHICFQPIFINALSLYFVPDKLRERVQSVVFAFAFALGVVYLLRLVPFDWLQNCVDAAYRLLGCKQCSFPIPLCGKRLCAVSGSWHIAWEMPLKFQILWEHSYLVAAFLLPLLYGAWRITLYLFLAGPVLAALTTKNPNEWPAIWCLFSTLIISVAVSRRFRESMRQKSWYGRAVASPGE